MNLINHIFVKSAFSPKKMRKYQINQRMEMKTE